MQRGRRSIHRRFVLALVGWTWVGAMGAGGVPGVGELPGQVERRPSKDGRETGVLPPLAQNGSGDSGVQTGTLPSPESVIAEINNGNILLSLFAEGSDAPQDGAGEVPPIEPVVAPEGDLPNGEGNGQVGPLPEGGGEANPALIAGGDAGLGPGMVEGEIYDEGGAGIVRVFVSVPELGVRTQTDQEGKFTLRGLPLGRHQVKLTKNGYVTGTHEVLIEDAEVPAKLSKELALRPIELDDTEYLQEDFDVVEEYVEEAPIDIILGQAKSDTFVSGLGRADFEKAALSDAGDAVEKVSGANIVDGKFAVVRGLADRYVSTTFNGGAISSAVPSRKAVELDLFPTSAIEAIAVEKTFDPRLGGDFGGAAIDIVGRIYPEKQILNVKVKGSYDSDLPDKTFIHPDRSLGFFGKIDDTIDLDRILAPSPGNGGLRLITSPPGPAREAWTYLLGTRTPVADSDGSEHPLSFGITYGQTFQLAPHLKLGVLAAGGQKSSDSFNSSRQFRSSGQSWQAEEYSRTRDWNFYLAAGLKFKDLHEINGTFFRKHIAQHNITRGRDFRHPEGSLGYGRTGAADLAGTRNFYGADAEVLGNFWEIEPLERDLEIMQLSGKHRLSERSPRVNWSYTDSTAEESRPNTTFFQFATLDFTSEALAQELGRQQQGVIDLVETAFGLPAGSVPDYDAAKQVLIDEGFGDRIPILERNFPVIDESLGQVDTLAVRLYNPQATNVGSGNEINFATQSIKETTKDAQIGIEIPIYLEEDHERRGFELGFGTQKTDKLRKARGTTYEFILEELNAAGELISGFEANDFYPVADEDQDGNFVEDEDGDGIFNLGELLLADPSLIGTFITGATQGAPYFIDASTGTDNFTGLVASNADGSHDLEAFYLSGHLFWDDYFIKGGVRYESEDRVATYLEPAPFGIEDPAPISEEVWLPSISVGAALFDGRLKLSGAWSRTVARPTFHEWVPTRSLDLSTGLLRFGRADLRNAQITNFDLAAHYQINENSSVRLSVFKKELKEPIIENQVSGVADVVTYANGDFGNVAGVELELDLTKLGPFSLRSNVTFIDAEVGYTLDTNVQVTESFPYQPNWIANVNLGYDNDDLGLGCNLVYNYTGEYATVLRTRPTDPNVVRNAQHALDLIIRKKFGEEEEGQSQLVVGVKNLFATDQEFSFEGGRPGVDGVLRNVKESDRVYFIEFKRDF